MSMTWERLGSMLLEETGNTLLMTLPATFFAYLIGLPLGVLLVITDQNMRTSNITTADVFTSNGVIHVIDKVILPQ